MAVDRRARGHAVEVAARDLLQRAGLTELATNANYRGGELDLRKIRAGGIDVLPGGVCQYGARQVGAGQLYMPPFALR